MARAAFVFAVPYVEQMSSTTQIAECTGSGHLRQIIVAIPLLFLCHMSSHAIAHTRTHSIPRIHKKRNKHAHNRKYTQAQAQTHTFISINTSACVYCVSELVSNKSSPNEFAYGDRKILTNSLLQRLDVREHGPVHFFDQQPNNAQNLKYYG